jgi:hypothetical protein
LLVAEAVTPYSAKLAARPVRATPPVTMIDRLRRLRQERLEKDRRRT